MSDLQEVFERFGGDDADPSEFLRFERVESPLHCRPDLCAFLLLDKLVPGTRDMVAGASHDQIFLDTDCEKLAAVATEDDVLTLVRCGVMFDEEQNSLSMFA